MAEYTPEQDVDVGRDRPDRVDDHVDEDYRDGDAHVDDRYEEAASEEPDQAPQEREFGAGADRARTYRPGRGGFDPEAAEIAARAKYTYRQRVVVSLLCAAVVTAIVAAVLAPVLWWLHAIVDVSLVGYLVYLRRQVRIENDIRERRSARLRGPGEQRVRGASESAERAEPELHEDYDGEIVDESDEYGETERDRVERAARSMRRPQRKPVAEPIQHNGVYVDLDDEDPEFHELGTPPADQGLRKASGQ